MYIHAYEDTLQKLEEIVKAQFIIVEFYSINHQTDLQWNKAWFDI